MTLDKFPDADPSITLDFLKSKKLDPRITFSRASNAGTTPPTTGDGTGMVNGEVYTFQENVPRLTSQGLLIEEARTNYCENYTDFFSTYSNCTKAAGLSPAGDNTAQVITATANGTTSLRTTGSNTPVTIPTNTEGITASLYVKGSYSSILFKIFAGSTKQQVTFQNFNTPTWTVSANTGSHPSSNYQVEDAGNGWYRLSFSAPISNQSIGFWVDSESLTAGETYSVWLPQIEVGAFATSAIPTEVASAVTRAADLCAITDETIVGNLNSWYQTSSGTYVTTAETFSIGGRVYAHHRSGPSHRTAMGTNEQFIYFGHGMVGQLRMSIQNYPLQTPVKASFAVASENGGGAINGILGTPQSNNAVAPAESELLWLGRENNSAFLNGYIQYFAFYPTRLPDDALIALTTQQT